jgi:hypothetical protein
VKVLIQNHDALLLQHPPEMRPYIYSELSTLLRVDLTIKGRTFFIPIEMKSGPNWKELG